MARRRNLGLIGLAAVVLVLVVVWLITRGGGGSNSARHGSLSVSSISPSSGATFGTTQVKIEGSGFWCGRGEAQPGTRVEFGGRSVVLGTTNHPGGAQNITSVTDSEILVTTPAADAGAVHVRVSTPCGISQSTNADRFNYLGECSSSCELDVSDHTRGDAHPLIGWLDGTQGGFSPPSSVSTEAAYLDQLRPSVWRIASDNGANAALYNALKTKPRLEFLLGDGFMAATGMATPWADGYQAWDAYLDAMVHGRDYAGNVSTVKSAPGPVAYWDIWNEPQTFAGSSTWTSDQTFDLFAHTYVQLRKLDAASQQNTNAKILAPSSGVFVDQRLPAAGSLNARNYLSFPDLIARIEAYNKAHESAPLEFDGFTMHVINAGGVCYAANTGSVPGCVSYPLNAPAALADTANRMRNQLAATDDPSLAKAEIHINEFGTGSAPHNGDPTLPRDAGSDLMPGWQAGFIAAAEDADVTTAGLSCWNTYFGAGNLRTYSLCSKGMDGLLGDANASVGGPGTLGIGVTPQAIYWVYGFYSQMVGTRLATAGSASDVTGYATKDDRTSTVKVLLGRHRRCSVDTSRDPACPAGGPAVSVRMQVAWPYGGGSVHYSLLHIPNVGGGLGGPLPTMQASANGTADVHGGMATITVPNVADAEAIGLTLSR